GHRPPLQWAPIFQKEETNVNLLGVLNDIHRTLGEVRHELGKIQGELIEIRSLSYRVSMVEQWQWWLKGGWAVLAALCGYLFHGTWSPTPRCHVGVCGSLYCASRRAEQNRLRRLRHVARGRNCDRPGTSRFEGRTTSRRCKTSVGRAGQVLQPLLRLRAVALA